MLFHCSDDCRPVILTRRFWQRAHFELYNHLKINSVAYERRPVSGLSGCPSYTFALLQKLGNFLRSYRSRAVGLLEFISANCVQSDWGHDEIKYRHMDGI